MKKLLIISLLALALSTRASAAVTSEYIILVGGPSLQEWEKYKAQPHDHWWANFFSLTGDPRRNLIPSRTSQKFSSMIPVCERPIISANFNSRPLPAEVLVRISP